MKIDDVSNASYVYLSAGGAYVSIVGVGAIPMFDNGYRYPSMGCSRVPLRLKGQGDKIFTIESMEHTLVPGHSYLGAWWSNTYCYYWDANQGDNIKWRFEFINDNTVLITNVANGQYLAPKGNWLTTSKDRYEWKIQPFTLNMA